jgi:Zn-dependent peptidase ImmA (M78 family)
MIPTPIIAALRDLTPHKPLTVAESLFAAEQQAARLLQLTNTTAPAVPATVITNLPVVTVEPRLGLEAASVSRWVEPHRGWTIYFDAALDHRSVRLRLAHELKRIVDWPFRLDLYRDEADMTRQERASQAADYFAACLLMPRAWVSAALDQGICGLQALADHFDVPPAAMRIRLFGLGLLHQLKGCPNGRD